MVHAHVGAAHNKKTGHVCTKEPYTSAKEPYVSAKEPCISAKELQKKFTFVAHAHIEVRLITLRALLRINKAFFCAKEPYISAKEPYISAKEPYVNI